jgi:hypothetical protein
MVVGPLALQQAKKVAGLTIAGDGKVLIKATNPKKTLSDLVSQYEKLFGKASVEVCKDAVKESGANIPQEQLPEVLRY